MTTNARISTVAPGITREIVAEQTHIFYDPASKSGSVSFQHRPSLYIGDVFNGPAGDYGVLQLQLADVATRTFATGTDPVTGADLSQISAAGVEEILKQTFDIAYNEQAGE